MGIIPAIIARLVISTGRKRSAAADRAAETASAPFRRFCSAKVTSRIAFATATPMAIIVPMKLSRFSVVPVSKSIRMAPTSTAGALEMTIRARRKD
jgi:hypothetical protein